MADIVLLDGGMGQELIHRSSQPPSPLWSARVMMDEPHIVEAVHREYIDAGALVLTLNSYSATPERLARDASADLFEPLQAKAIAIARAARGDRTITIAGCLSPLYGSYHPEWAPSFEECLATYRRIVAEQRDAVDVFLCETLSSIKEVRAAVQAAVESGKPVWCGMSVNDTDGTKLRSGEDLERAASAAGEAGAEAVLINCSWPEAVTQGQAVLARTGLAHGGYANGFTKADTLQIGGTVSGLTARTDLGPEAYADHAMRWIDAGAMIVGGCCEVGPAHIAHLAERLVAEGHVLKGALK
ncbi:MAG: homocysteine S-methyltransferase family protein [Hoeflea sp.]|uniref:homocysteine S-methyltransferase family protein n=1 Tax=Hoeflea sp. TaxID=1940281 RepID=UPI001D3FFAA2|nr:homocysteine S-methyltransferase family protein [Hoeflea sp.]MBU4527372.1 homocysteine S-methyltransferase family protein [Alphaproteobacteria bacterium]MBU4546845.1 homocysteine S-methyltransferase family protein [Alphaproteobacteria bacterium]MBU4551643.1 homocysteine S-methyltransferase family protein [Alphaproteobacteria bacterium]MBV1725648.1 homocysteine S-methyltransferase family protein [Hoeflea sp.]MBV1759696.1 homocysteine S-methyltransferase family protein [Hoeflea sp.]